jgi:hypothetical protein
MYYIPNMCNAIKVANIGFLHERKSNYIKLSIEHKFSIAIKCLKVNCDFEPKRPQSKCLNAHGHQEFIVFANHIRL